MFPPHGALRQSRLSRSLKREAGDSWEAAGQDEARRSVSGGLPHMPSAALPAGPAGQPVHSYTTSAHRRQNSSGGSDGGGGKRHQNQRLSRSQDFGSVVASGDNGDGGVVDGRPAPQPFMQPPGHVPPPGGSLNPPPPLHPSLYSVQHHQNHHQLQRRPSAR